MMNRPAFGRSVTGGHQRAPGMMPTSHHLAAFGRHGDTELAHVNPQEKAMLEAMGGAGTRNPHTGMPEYYGIGSDRGATGTVDRGGRPGSGARGTGRSDQGGGGFQNSPEVGGSPGRRARLAALGGFAKSDVDRAAAPGASAGLTGFSTVGRLGGAMGILGLGGLNAKPALNPQNSAIEGQVNYNPIQQVTFGAFSPDFANIPLGRGAIEAPSMSERRDATSPEDRKRMGRSLVNAVLGKEEDPAPVATPPPAQRSFVPFQGDYLTYGQPGGAAEHAFFRG